MTTAIEMGTTRTGEPGLIDLAELLATRLLVQGNSGSGKSHLLRRLLEQSAPLVQQAIIDPEGDFVSLAEQFGHVVVDAECGEAELQRVALRVTWRALENAGINPDDLAGHDVGCYIGASGAGNIGTSTRCGPVVVRM